MKMDVQPPLSAKTGEKQAAGPLFREIMLFGTLGPACEKTEQLSRLLSAGMGGLRLNLSHGGLARRQDQLSAAKKAAAEMGRRLTTLIDLQGPELRVGEKGLPRTLRTGENLPPEALCLPEALSGLEPGQRLLLDDGKLEGEILPDGRVRILRGGPLLPRKSVAVPGRQAALPPLTNADLENLALAPRLGIDGVMQPFVRGREDLLAVRKALDQAGGERIQLFAKVENQQGLDTLPEWIDLADWVVIARGDLGNAVTLPRLPAAQKRIAALCRARNKPFVVATQLLGTMESNPAPTRAEVSDIFNAVLDGAAGLMLTGETAAGRYPVEAMSVLRETAEAGLAFCREREENPYGLH